MRLPAAVEQRALELAGVPLASALPAGISEAEFTVEVLRLAKLLGWRAAHFRSVRVQHKNGRTYYETPMQGDRGFPDLVLVRDRALWVELKRAGGRVSPAQQLWLNDLRAAGEFAVVWRPEDWAEVQRTLGRRP